MNEKAHEPLPPAGAEDAAADATGGAGGANGARANDTTQTAAEASGAAAERGGAPASATDTAKAADTAGTADVASDGPASTDAGTAAVPAGTAPLPGAAATATGPRRPPPDLGTRLAGLGWVALSTLLVWFFAGQAFRSDLGTEDAGLRALVRALAVLVPGYPGALGLVALITGRRPPLRFNLLSLPFEGWWFSTLGTLAWREVKTFYGRPGAYIVLFMWLLLNGVFMVLLLDAFAGPQSWGRDFQEPASVYLTSHWLAIVGLAFIAPALTMRLLAEESSTGSMEMLLTAPVTDAQVALSKYLGVLAYYLAMLLAIGAYLAVVRGYATEWDWGPIVSGYLGLFLLGALFLSVGLFTSSVTSNQIVAFILALVPILALVFGTLVLKDVVHFDGARDVLAQLNVWDHQAQFAKGVVQWRAVAFYVSGTAFFLFLSVRGVESHTWR